MMRWALVAVAIALAAATPAHAAQRRIVRLDRCAPGPECQLPRRATFPTYGNLQFGDCWAAAAADWLWIAQGIKVPAASVIRAWRSEERASGGKNDTVEYLEERGIDGYKLRFADELLQFASLQEWTPEAIRTQLRKHSALYAEVSLPAYGNAGHAVVADGFTPAGPLIVTWGETFQWTWARWADEVHAIFVLTVR
jgi:hypothetical protein